MNIGEIFLELCISSPKPLRPALGPPTLQFSGYRGSFLRVKRPGREVDYTPQSSAEVKNKRSYISSHLLCLHGVERDNVTFIRHVGLLVTFIVPQVLLKFV